MLKRFRRFYALGLFSRFFFLAILIGASASIPASANSAELDMGFRENSVAYDEGCNRLYSYLSSRAKANKAYVFRYNAIYATMSRSGGADPIVLTSEKTPYTRACDEGFTSDKPIISDRYRIIFDLHYADSFVLISEEACAANPTLVFVTPDSYLEYTNNRGRTRRHTTLFSHSYYDGNSTVPTSLSDLEFGYTDIFSRGLYTKVSDIPFDAKFMFPHQFYARSGLQVKMPVNLADMNSLNSADSTYGRNAVEIGLFYSLQAINAQCGKIPETINIKGIVFLRQKQSSYPVWKLHFSGKIVTSDENSGIEPDPAYREIAELFSTFYAAVDEAKGHTYPTSGLGLDSDTKMALGAAFFISIIAVNRMVECNNNPDLNC